MSSELSLPFPFVALVVQSCIRIPTASRAHSRHSELPPFNPPNPSNPIRRVTVAVESFAPFKQPLALQRCHSPCPVNRRLGLHDHLDGLDTVETTIESV